MRTDCLSTDLTPQVRRISVCERACVRVSLSSVSVFFSAEEERLRHIPNTSSHFQSDSTDVNVHPAADRCKLSYKLKFDQSHLCPSNTHTRALHRCTLTKYIHTQAHHTYTHQINTCTPNTHTTLTIGWVGALCLHAKWLSLLKRDLWGIIIIISVYYLSILLFHKEHVSSMSSSSISQVSLSFSNFQFPKLGI